jgi:hypothetical protein
VEDIGDVSSSGGEVMWTVGGSSGGEVMWTVSEGPDSRRIPNIQGLL